MFFIRALVVANKPNDTTCCNGVPLYINIVIYYRVFDCSRMNSLSCCAGMRETKLLVTLPNRLEQQSEARTWSMTIKKFFFIG